MDRKPSVHDKIDKIVADLSEQKTHNALLHQKLDYLVSNQIQSERIIRDRCDEHRRWTASVEKKVSDHEGIKNRIFGAARVIAWAGGSGTVIGGIIAVVTKIMKHRGG